MQKASTDDASETTLCVDEITTKPELPKQSFGRQCQQRLGRIAMLARSTIVLYVLTINDVLVIPLVYRGGTYSMLQIIIDGFYLLLCLGCAGAILLTAIQRLHDFNTNALPIVLLCIPPLSLLVLILILVFPGDTGDNLYGEPVIPRVWEKIMASMGFLLWLALVLFFIPRLRIYPLF